MKIPHDPDEIVALVDENDEIVGESRRLDVHLKGFMHREVAVAIVNSKGQMLMHKRADNGQWDPSAAGHFPKDFSYEEAAVKEVEEELGIMIEQSELKEICYQVFRNRIDDAKDNNRFVKAFMVVRDMDIEEFNIDPGEVAEVRWMGKEEIDSIANSDEKAMTTAARVIIQEKLGDVLK